MTQPAPPKSPNAKPISLVSSPPQQAKPVPALRPNLIEYAAHRDTVNGLYGKILRATKPTKTFFDRAGQQVRVQVGKGVQLLTSSTLNGHLASVPVEFSFGKIVKRKFVHQRFGVLEANLVAAFLSSPRVIHQLPKLQHYTRVPVFDSNWQLINTPGYHDASGIFYDGEKVRPRQRTPLLDRLLSGFCWRSDVDRVNYIGVLLTAITMRHWIGQHPLVIFNGNQPRLGKSTLGRIIGLLIDGWCPTISYNANDEEFERVIATCIEAGDRVVVVDNAKAKDRTPEVSSAALERSTTDRILNFRRLRTNTAIRRENDVIFELTMNAAKMSIDLRLRGIPINLHFDGDVRDRHFELEDIDGWVLEHRLEIIAELLGMVVRWIKARRPIPANPAKHTISQQWAASIDGMLSANGYRGFLANFDESQREYDLDYAAIRSVCAALHHEPATTAAEWAIRIVRAGLLEHRLRDERGELRTGQGMATVVGNLMNGCAGERFKVDAGLFCLHRQPEKGSASHECPTYGFERMDDADDKE